MKFLEAHKSFPYIAWTALILFALLTYFLATELKQTASYLDGKTQERVDAIESV